MSTIEHASLVPNDTQRPAVFQDRLDLLYPTSEKLLLGQEPHIVTSATRVDLPPHTPRLRIALSDIEALWPWYRENTHPTIQREIKKSFDADTITTAAVMGTRLHQAYTAYGIVIQGLSGPAIDQALPTLSSKRRQYLEVVTDGVPRPTVMTDAQCVYESLSLISQHLFTCPAPPDLHTQTVPLALQLDHPLQDPRLAESVWYDPSTKAATDQLAETIANALAYDQPPLGLNPEGDTLFSFGVIANFQEAPLQVTTEYDAFILTHHTRGKVTAHAADLKSSPAPTHGLAAEIRQVQSTTMLLIAEAATATLAIRGRRQNIHGSPLVVSVNESSERSRGRSDLTYTVFDRHEGSLTPEPTFV